jgi:hypothetical protein
MSLTGVKRIVNVRSFLLDKTLSQYYSHNVTFMNIGP